MLPLYCRVSHFCAMWVNLHIVRDGLVDEDPALSLRSLLLARILLMVHQTSSDQRFTPANRRFGHELHRSPLLKRGSVRQELFFRGVIDVDMEKRV